MRGGSLFQTHTHTQAPLILPLKTGTHLGVCPPAVEEKKCSRITSTRLAAQQHPVPQYGCVCVCVLSQAESVSQG